MMGERFQVVIEYAGDPCPLPGCLPGSACIATYDDVAPEIAQELLRIWQAPRWLRGISQLRFRSPDFGLVHVYELDRVLSLRAQPMREVL